MPFHVLAKFFLMLFSALSVSGILCAQAAQAEQSTSAAVPAVENEGTKEMVSPAVPSASVPQTPESQPVPAVQPVSASAPAPQPASPESQPVPAVQPVSAPAQQPAQPALPTPSSATAAAVAASLASPTSRPVVKAPRSAPAKQPARQIRYIKYDGKRYVLLRDVADYYELTQVETQSTVVLYSKSHRIEFIRKRREGSIDGVKTYFLSTLIEKSGQLYLYEEDFMRVIDPVLRKKVLAKQRIRTIMLDPGHGGQDSGAKGPVLPEKQINLILALKLRKALELMGFTVLMTRDKDTFPTLENRANMCRNQMPDLYISIHCNSTTTRSVVGIETYAMTPAGGTSTADVRGQDRIYANNKWDRNNYRLAYEVQKSLLKFTKKEDRGVRHARFYVLRYATCPAILVECGFLSNIEEGKELASGAQQNRLVAAILSGIAHYYTALR